MPDEQKRYRQVCRGNEWDDMVEDQDGDWIKPLPGVVTLSGEEAEQVSIALEGSIRLMRRCGYPIAASAADDALRIITRAQKEG